MPHTEKKGRFTVIVSEAPRPGGAPQHAGQSPSSSSPLGRQGAPGPPPVKRGRFLVSCLPCAVPCLGATRSSDDDAAAAAPAAAAGQPARARSPSDDGGPFASCPAAAAAAGAPPPARGGLLSAGTPQLQEFSSVPAPGRDMRRVRFHEALPSPPQQAQQTQQAQAQQQQARLLPRPPSSPQPRPPAAAAAVALQPTRSYCRGRFVVQESIAACGSLARSISVPDHCHLAAALAPAAASCLAAGCHAVPQAKLASSSGASSSSSSSSAGYYDLLLAGPLLPQHELPPPQHGGAAVAAAVLLSSCSAPGGLFGACSASPAPSDASISDDSCLMASAELLSDELGLPGGGGGAHHGHSHSAGEAHAPHRTPKRSQSMSFFRRGRFLVQTTYA